MNKNFPNQVGGALPPTDKTYIERQADRDLLTNIEEKQFCYVLSPRQTGKSSLRIRTSSILRDRGFVGVSIDLSTVGTNGVTAEQWYQSFLSELIDELNIDVDLRQWWENSPDLSPVKKLDNFFKKVVLIQIKQPIVIFIDEVDSTLRLGFSLDDFWAWMKGCFDRRNNDPEYQRIIFVLLGVTTPNDLCKEPDRSPLNIGTEINLTGFEAQDMNRLVTEIGINVTNLKSFLGQIHHLTGGQPFLTQKVFRLIHKSQNINIDDRDEIEKLIRDGIIINWENQDKPEHLKTIRNRIISSEKKIQLLFLYQKICQSREVDCQDRDLIHQELRLSGLVIKRDGKLRIQNQIYREVFDIQWTQAQLKNLGIIHQRYHIKNEIGRGGFGVTYLAEDFNIPSHPTEVVLKQLSPHPDNQAYITELRKYFEREAVILRGLKWNSIPTFYDYFEEGGEFFQVHEYIEGETLDNELSTCNNEIAVIELLDEILDILSFIHNIQPQPLIHRDIKPSNIIRRKNGGKLVLIDFGAAVKVQSSNHTTMGTPGYAPPEQENGDSCCQSDIYALGIVGIQALTGQRPLRPPLSGNNPNWENIKNSNASQKLQDILCKMTELKVENRYQSAQEVLADLAKLKQKAINAPIPTTIVIPNTRKSQFNKWTKRLIPALLGMILVVSASFQVPRNNPDTPALTIDLLSATDVSISNGSKEILDRKTLTGTFKTLKDQAIKDFINGNYKEAYKKFYELRQKSMPIDSTKSVTEKNPDAPAARKDNQLLIDMNNAAAARKDPQLLIYMNNAKVRYLQKIDKNIKIHTIAAAFPTGEERGEQALYGIAHLQHNVVNPKKEIKDLKDINKMQSFLNDTPNVYLEILIANDENKPVTAKELADKLTKGFINDTNGKKQPILAVIGHYTSEASCAALRTYSRANKLPLISPLSTVTEFRSKCEDEKNKVFFRTATSSTLEANALAKVVKEYKKTSNNNPKIIAFYKSDKQFKGKSSKFSQNLFDEFEKALKPQDISKSFDLNDNDSVVSGLTEIQGADIIVLLPDGKNAGSGTNLNNDSSFINAMKVLKAKDLKKDCLILGSNPLLTSLDQETLKNLHNKLLIAVEWSEDKKIGEKTFIDRYRDKDTGLWGGSLNRTTALSYEAAQVLSQVLSDLGKNGKAITGQEIISALINVKVKSDVFVDKDISFNENGDRVGINERILVTPARSGEFVLYPIPTPTLP